MPGTKIDGRATVAGLWQGAHSCAHSRTRGGSGKNKFVVARQCNFRSKKSHSNGGSMPWAGGSPFRAFFHGLGGVLSAPEPEHGARNGVLQDMVFEATRIGVCLSCEKVLLCRSHNLAHTLPQPPRRVFAVWGPQESPKKSELVTVQVRRGPFPSSVPPQRVGVGWCNYFGGVRLLDDGSAWSLSRVCLFV